MDSSDTLETGEVVLFPLRSQDPDVKVLRVARVPRGQLDDTSVQHIAGGPYKGIIVSKATQELPTREKPECVREFLAHVQNTTANDGDTEIIEKRQIFMWFVGGTDEKQNVADRFFREVIDPDHFPKDYISFVKKVIVLARNYPEIRVLELEMLPMAPGYGSPPVSPGYGTSNNRASIVMDTGEKTPQKETTDLPPKSSTRTVESTESDDIEKQPKKIKPDPPPRTSSTHGTETIDINIVNNNTPLSSEDNKSPRTQEDIRITEDSALSAGDEYLASNHDTSNVSSGSILRRKQDDSHVTEVDDTFMNGVSENLSAQNGVQPEAVPLAEEAPLSEQDHENIREHIMLIMEDAFPMALKAEHIADDARIGVKITREMLKEFKDRGLAQELSDGRWIRVSTIKRKKKSQRQSGNYTARASFVRASVPKHDFQVVPQMPILPEREQPSVAVITLLFCEKQAVDAMMDSKTTYVRYKTEGAGENQVYTVGVIGSHKVVSTKLTRLGTGQGATVSAGNSITRLLGTFGRIEHVFLVGVGGSIPNYTDDAGHIRCGDVVVSKPSFPGAPTYIYVTDVNTDKSNEVNFGTQFWDPKDETVSQIISNLSERYGPHSMTNTDVGQNIQNGLAELGGQELSFSRPPSQSDRLHRMDPDGAWQEVSHPDPQRDSNRTMYPDRPSVYFGSVGAGFDQLVQGKNDWRQEFATFNDIKALDSGYQAVMESIHGNRKDSFWIIRGIADYTDGMSGTEWQPYASLVAAAAMKTILMKITAGRI